MDFPVYIHVGSLRIHPHVLFEALAYFIGFRIYLWTRRPSGMSKLVSLQILAGTILGAAIGSKVLFWLEDPAATWAAFSQGHFLWGGKTIVGGLLGGLIGVELAKKWAGWKSSTGDDFAYPMLIGIAIGRIGCFLTGLDDHTYGTATSLFTGVDFGDGVLRHPTQLYEMGFLIVLGIVLYPMYRQSRASWKKETASIATVSSPAIKTGTAQGIAPATERAATSVSTTTTSSEAHAPLSLSPLSADHITKDTNVSSGYVSGRLFQWFMFGYLGFRLLIEFIKPTLHPYWGLNNIQLACIAGLIYYSWLLLKGRGDLLRRQTTRANMAK
ncbi:prolipoprotein diacylglyceryl transferase [Paenibacillus wenxiniae]|uniref:Prolipoprotein diacylglyceryl transferase n=1 Tax=Paenibacillus wenxiniae TaxID=1636843 RepID=A0ABW4RMZ7_9BACL